LENFEVYVGEIRIMMICFDYIVVLIVHKHFVVKEIQFSHTPISGFQPTGLVPSSPLHLMAVKYGALLTGIQLDVLQHELVFTV
jgi:hypothetical protein